MIVATDRQARTRKPACRSRPAAGRTPTKPFGNGRRPLPEPAAAPAPPTPALASDRDGGGRFVKGNKGGPGNPYARRVAALRSALLSAVGEDNMLRLGRKLLAQALEGDTAAAKLLLAYTLGKPSRAADPDRVDLDELKQLEECPEADVIGQAMRSKIDPADAAAFVRAALKVVSPAFFARLATELRDKRS